MLYYLLVSEMLSLTLATLSSFTVGPRTVKMLTLSVSLLGAASPIGKDVEVSIRVAT